MTWSAAVQSVPGTLPAVRRWTFHPLGDMFIVYNHNLARSLAPREQFTFESNQLLVKLEYATRL